jgi:small subunit ribosomal protein S4
MLPVTSKYRIAKRLGAGIFEQTQTQKFALSEARSAKTKKRGGRGGSEYGRQLLEKQRVRFTYGITERQLASYAKVAYEEENPSLSLHRALENRADSVMYRAGFASTRRAARQMVSHGHVVINGKRTKVPSHQVKKNDAITVREGSRTSALFAHLGNAEVTKRTPPQWLEVDTDLMKIKVLGEASYAPGETGLDYSAVFEFYSR